MLFNAVVMNFPTSTFFKILSIMQSVHSPRYKTNLETPPKCVDAKMKQHLPTLFLCSQFLPEMMKSFPHKHSKTSQDLKNYDCVIACGTPHHIGETRNARENVKKGGGVAKREVLYLYLSYT